MSAPRKAPKEQRYRARYHPPADISEKRCSRCKKDQPIALYNPRAESKDGWGYYCRPCVSGIKHDERSAQADYQHTRWRNLSRPMLESRLLDLILAAQKARSAGRWQGRPGLRAYKWLGEALDALHVPEPEDKEMDDFTPDAADDERRAAQGG